MNFEEIFSRTKEYLTQCGDIDYMGHLAVEVFIKGDGSGTFYIEVNDGKIAVEPYDYHDHDCKLIVSAKNFFKLADGSLNPVAAFTTGRLKIERSIEKALEFQKVLEAVGKNKKK